MFTLEVHIIYDYDYWELLPIVVKTVARDWCRVLHDANLNMIMFLAWVSFQTSCLQVFKD